MDANPVIHEFMAEHALERNLHYVRIRLDGSYTLAKDGDAPQLVSSPASPFTREIAKLAQQLHHTRPKP